MYKTLPTLENEKEYQEIKFYEKSLGEFIFSWATVLFHLPEWASAQKVRLHHCYLIQSFMFQKIFSVFRSQDVNIFIYIQIVVTLQFLPGEIDLMI